MLFVNRGRIDINCHNFYDAEYAGTLRGGLSLAKLSKSVGDAGF
jgi:hypothetical protein